MSTEHKVYFAPMMANELGLGFTDKRNRNPNWTDHEIIRYLEILSEDQVIKDLAANRNKQVMLKMYSAFFQLLIVRLGFLLCFPKNGSRRVREELGPMPDQNQELEKPVPVCEGPHPQH